MDFSCWNALPFGDQWSEIVTGRQVTWSWLFSQHVEHRLVFPRLIFLADSWLAAETNIVNYIVNFAIQAGLAVWLLRFSDKAELTDRSSRLWKAGFALALLFWAGQYQNFVWGFQSQFFGVIAAAFATFAVVATGRNATWLAGALLLETIAVYCLASGVMVPLLAICLAWLCGRSRQSLTILTCAAGLLITSYLWNYHTPHESADPLSAWHHIPTIAIYMLVILGAPVGNIVLLHTTILTGVAISAIAGLLIVYSYARLIVKLVIERRTIAPHQMTLITFAAFLLGMLLVTASGRYVKGIESALVSRYTTPANIFWYCVCIMAAARSCEGGRVPAAIMFAVLPLPLLMALTEADNVAVARDWVSLRRAATPALLAHVEDIDMLKLVYAIEPDGKLENSAAVRFVPALRAARHSVFAADWASWLGTPITDHVTTKAGASCIGTVGTSLIFHPVNGFGWRVTGHAWRTPNGKSVDRLLIVNQVGTIVGYGLGGINLRTIGLENDSEARAGGDWIGAFSNATPDGIRVYTLSGLQDICPMSTPRRGG